MKKLKTIMAKVAALLPALALVMGVISANSACVSMFHQPETPEAMNAFRR